SGDAHIALMKAVRPGVGTEAELHALFEYECFREGARQAYTAIIAGGRNGSVLHYISNKDPIPANPADMLLVDAAGEFSYYSADITRTYPLGGRFEGDWKTTYEIVLEMFKAVLSQLRAGVKWEDMHRVAERVALDGLVKAGLITGSTEELLANHIPALFFPHGLGHLIGLDTHDCGGYPKGVERIQEPGIRYLRMRRELKAGMVVTVEPGVYFVDPILKNAVADPAINKYLNLDVVERFRKNVGGVRIEDDVVILADGYDNLSEFVPKEIADIERIMAR
ncbi:peptidase M24, structural domain-containing protein, partial [Blyttiomyces helicus]